MGPVLPDDRIVALAGGKPKGNRCPDLARFTFDLGMGFWVQTMQTVWRLSCRRRSSPCCSRPAGNLDRAKR